VFDGAAKFQGVCINDYIRTGPSVMNELVAVVHRFRQYNHAVMGDVKEMFLQVRVPNEERDYLRFLWYEEGRIVIYRYKVHLFGKCDSPCVSMAAIFLQTLKYKDKFPEAFETIAKASLVDETRGLTIIKLLEAKSWLDGPDLLYQQESAWPEQPPEPGRDLADILPETITGLKKKKKKKGKH
jgi:hypothetical protein